MLQPNWQGMVKYTCCILSPQQYTEVSVYEKFKNGCALPLSLGAKLIQKTKDVQSCWLGYFATLKNRIHVPWKTGFSFGQRVYNRILFGTFQAKTHWEEREHEYYRMGKEVEYVLKQNKKLQEQVSLENDSWGYCVYTFSCIYLLSSGSTYRV